MNLRRLAAALVVGSLLFSARAVRGGIGFDYYFIPDGTTYTDGGGSKFGYVIGYSGFDSATLQDPELNNNDYFVADLIIDGEQPFVGPTAATVNFNLTGAQTGYTEFFNTYLFLYNQSTFNLSAGKMDGSTFSFNSTINLSGTGIFGQTVYTHGGEFTINGAGSVNDLDAQDGTVVAMTSPQASAGSAVTQRGGVTIDSGAGLLMSDGSIYQLTVQGHNSTADLYKGNITGSITANNGGTVTIIGDNVDVTGSAAATGTDTPATLNIKSGTVEQDVDSSDPYGFVGISGGHIVGNVFAYDGTVNMTGGTVDGGVVANLGGKITLASGSIEGNVFANDTSMLGITGDVSIGGTIIAQSSGQINMTGGTVAGSVEGHDNSIIFLGKGQVSGGASLDGQAFLYVLDNGHVVGDIHASDDSTVTVSGGVVEGGLATSYGTEAKLSGGSVARVSTFNASSLTMTGGTILNDATAYNASTMELLGGTVGGDVDAYDGSTITVSGTAIFGSVYEHDHGKVIIYSNGSMAGGPGVQPHFLSEVPQFGLAGATGLLPSLEPIAPLQIYLYDNSTVEIDGIDFNLSLLDPNNGGTFSEYSVSGLFADGSAFGNGSGFQLFVQNGTNAAFDLVQVPPVPEPSSVTLFAGVGILLAAGRRRVRSA